MLESEGKNLHLNQNETSNYASAESSPNGSMIASPSSHSLRSNTSLHADETVKSKLSQSISISSLLGTNKSLSVHPSLDDPSIVVPTTLQSKLVPSSTSTNALDKLLKQGEFSSLNSAEFQSLPPNILMSHAKSANDLEKDLLNDSLKQKSESQTIHDLVKSTVSNLIESTVKTSIEEMTKEVQQEKEKNLATKLMPSLFPSINTVSSSSPNPINNPFKYLMTDPEKQHAQIPKSPSQSIKTAATLSPNGSTIQDAVSIFNAEQSKLMNSSSVIEKLAQLNHKEHEKEDPILSASNIKDSKKLLITPGITPSNSQILNQPIKQSNSNHSMTVPDSSQEFCRNLNLNLAAAAANIAQAPIIVNEATNKETVCEHQRFTSNASTSSIHNDLKAILEGGKQEQKEDSNKLDKQKESPKPQREKLNRSNRSTKNKVENKNDDLMKLISMMKQMSENKEKPGQQIGGDESGHFRYTNEFLQQIRKERSSFIENIQPEIFKAYCYCMSGKYWDPEKYFDIIQYSGDYERVVQQNQQQQLKNQSNNQNHNGKKNVKKNQKSAKKTITNDANNNIKENILGHLGLGKNKEEVKQADKILLDLLKKNQEAKEETKQVNLMEMLNQKKTKNSNILGELFNQNQSGQNAPKHHPVILTAQELELSQINRPVNRLFTNLNKTPDLGSKLMSPNSCGTNSCTSECSSANSDNANNSEAYKQLIKNLSNHPLCTPSSTVSTRSPMENVLMKLQRKTSESEQNVVAKDGTNLLKQLLHLNPEESDKKQKPKRHHHHHHRKSLKQDDKQQVSVTSVESTVTTTTTTTITQTQFPSVNPHEKPSFQTTTSKQPEKPIQNQIENLFNKMKMTKSETVKVEAKKTDEKEHFNSLLNKIIVKPQQQQQEVKRESENILGKWFSGLNQQQSFQKPNFSARTLSEIELMSGHFP